MDKTQEKTKTTPPAPTSEPAPSFWQTLASYWQPPLSWTVILGFLIFVASYIAQLYGFSEADFGMPASWPPNPRISPFKFEVLPSHDRGHSDHGWLQTFHTFPFAGLTFGNYESFGPLRVLNEDRVQPAKGFGTHSHSEYEIFSYVVSGQLEHKDSMGHEEVLKRGDIQMTSAGTGIQHSEGCYGDEPVHFLQIWAFPSQKGLDPKYFTRHFSDEEKRDRFVRVVGPVNSSGISLGRNGRGPTPIHAPLNVYATLLSPGRAAHRVFSITSNSKAYVHHIQRSGYQPGNVTNGGTIVLNTDTTLREGDGSFVWVKTEQGRLSVTNTGSTPAEVLLFEMP